MVRRRRRIYVSIEDRINDLKKMKNIWSQIREARRLIRSVNDQKSLGVIKKILFNAWKKIREIDESYEVIKYKLGALLGFVEACLKLGNLNDLRSMVSKDRDYIWRLLSLSLENLRSSLIREGVYVASLLELLIESSSFEELESNRDLLGGFLELGIKNVYLKRLRLLGSGFI